MLDIHKLMAVLAERRPIFRKEDDFQKSLESLIREFHPGNVTKLEFNPLPYEKPRIRHDIFVQSGAESTVIELKYPTETVDIEHEGELFELKESGLDADGYYHCVEDIYRLEDTIAKCPNIQSGVFVLLTHRAPFWKKTRPSAGSAVFSLHEGRKLEGKLTYPDNSRSRKREPIDLRGTYELRWRSYSDLSPSKFHQFRYLAVEVGN